MNGNVEGFGAGCNGDVMCIVVQPNDQVLVGGNFTTFKGQNARGIFRMNADVPTGSMDASFNVGLGFDRGVNTLALQSDGKIVAGGFFDKFGIAVQNKIIRLNTNGTKDISFGNPAGANRPVYSVVLQNSGEILLGGDFSFYNNENVSSLTRLTGDGSKDSTFVNSILEKSYQDVHAIVKQPDGKILAGGLFSSSFEFGLNSIVRFNSDGTRDESFDTGSGFGGRVMAITLQTDGKMLIGGEYYSFRGVPGRSLVRLNSDGSRDETFVQGTGFDGSVYAIAVQPDGKIIVGGYFSTYNGANAVGIVRMNENGTIDPTFNTGLGFELGARKLIVQPDGKIIVAGLIYSFNGQPIHGITRLNPDGSQDAAFVGFGNDISVDDVFNIALQTDGKILIEGYISGNYPDNDGPGFARLNADGSLDTSFNYPGNAANATYVDNFALEASGKIIVAVTSTINDVNLSEIYRLDTDGSVIQNLTQGAGFSTPAQEILVADNKILVAGSFKYYDGTYASGLIRLHGNETLATGAFLPDAVILYPNPAQHVIHFKSPETIAAQAYEIFDATGKKITSDFMASDQIDVSGLSNGMYFLKLQTHVGINTIKFLKE